MSNKEIEPTAQALYDAKNASSEAIDRGSCLTRSTDNAVISIDDMGGGSMGCPWCGAANEDGATTCAVCRKPLRALHSQTPGGRDARQKEDQIPRRKTHHGGVPVRDDPQDAYWFSGWRRSPWYDFENMESIPGARLVYVGIALAFAALLAVAVMLPTLASCSMSR